VIATPSDQSTASSLAVAQRIASELVRVRTPRRSEIRGSDPSAFSRCSRRCVPIAAAEKTTWSAVNVLTARRRDSLALVQRAVTS
jgi:hypothetical protein